MADKASFLSELNSLAGASPTDAYSRATGTLKDMIGDLHKTLFHASSKVSILLEPGYRVNAGQQFNVVVRVPLKDYSATLFRAYVPETTGYPVSFDFYGETLVTAATDDDMRSRVLEFFRKPEIITQIHTLQELAA